MVKCWFTGHAWAPEMKLGLSYYKCKTCGKLMPFKLVTEESLVERDRKAYESQLAMARANEQLCEIGVCIHEEHQQRLLDPGPPPEYHGCLTGDYPHWKQADCDAELSKYKKGQHD